MQYIGFILGIIIFIINQLLFPMLSDVGKVLLIQLNLFLLVVIIYELKTNYIFDYIDKIIHPEDY